MTRRTPSIVPFVAVAALLVTSCGTAPTPELRPTATVEELMRSLIDPAADAIWDAYVVEASADGVVETIPESDGDWMRLRRHAVTLAESTNLLAMEGRRIAGPDSRSELPGIDLHPEAIQELVDEQWDVWVEQAQGLHDTSLILLQAIETQDLTAFLEAGTELDVACENCHSIFWYPGQADPRPAAP